MVKLIAGMNPGEMTELENHMTQIGTAVEEELDRLLPEVDESEEATLFEAMRYSVFAGGKRVRPMLVMAANEMLGGRQSRGLRVGAAMEMLHTYSLIQDDLPCMDNDDLRRGKPTCHIQFDETTALLASDALHSLCFEVLVDQETHTDPGVRTLLVKQFAEAAGGRGMVGGQMLDMMAESSSDKEMDQGALARLQRKKTGALFTACCEAAVALNGATREEHHRLASYARNLGLAFQMIDDVLDEVGDRETLGKTTQKDKEAGKATFASLLGVDGARRQAEFLVSQSIDYLSIFGERARVLELLARFTVSRGH